MKRKEGKNGKGFVSCISPKRCITNDEYIRQRGKNHRWKRLRCKAAWNRNLFNGKLILFFKSKGTANDRSSS